MDCKESETVGLDFLEVMIRVKCCGIDVITDPLMQRFVPDGYGNLPVIRTISGIVTRTGASVKRFKAGDEVAGIVPLDMAKTLHGIECTPIPAEYLIHKPVKLGWEISACCLLDGLNAYTALHYQARIRPGDTLLLCNGSDSAGIIMVQMAKHWGAKVLVTAANEEEAQILRMISNDSPQVFGGHQLLHNLVMDETGGLGVDCVIDNGIRQENFGKSSFDDDFSKPTKHDLISCLSVGGRWITNESNLQVDPPDSEILHMKGASICHLFPEMWLLSTFQQGRYLHILEDILEKASRGILRPHLMTVLPSSEVQSRSDLFPSKSAVIVKL